MEDAQLRGLVITVGKELDDAYLSFILPLADMNVIDKQAEKLKFIYTPLHGSGLNSVKKHV